jgi:hypothetical protein
MTTARVLEQLPRSEPCRMRLGTSGARSRHNVRRSRRVRLRIFLGRVCVPRLHYVQNVWFAAFGRHSRPLRCQLPPDLGFRSGWFDVMDSFHSQRLCPYVVGHSHVNHRGVRMGVLNSSISLFGACRCHHGVFYRNPQPHQVGRFRRIPSRYPLGTADLSLEGRARPFPRMHHAVYRGSPELRLMTDQWASRPTALMELRSVADSAAKTRGWR